MLFLTKRFNLGLALMLLCILLSACGPSPEEQTATSAALTASAATSTPTITPTPIPTPTPTPIPPTATLTITPTPMPTSTLETLPGSVPEGIIITFKGEKCTVSGPTEVPPGDLTFVVRDLSGQRQELYVLYYLDGKTHQDMVEKQGIPGRWWPKPIWTDYANIIDVWRDTSRSEKYYTYSLEEGEHSLFLGSSSPVSNWICASLWVK